MAGARAERIGAMIGGAVREAVRESGTRGVALLDDCSAESGLLAAWCAAALGPERVWRVRPPGGDALEALGALVGAVGPLPGGTLAAEAHRLLLRLRSAAERALAAHPANKTALLLGPLPPEPLLPLGDLYASEVESLAGAWSAPPPVDEWAEAAGGVSVLDRALRAWLEERRTLTESMALLPPELADAVGAAVRRARFWRRRVGLVPKLGTRTLGIDVFS